MEWVNIAADENEEPVEVPTENDGTINLASITAQFPGATGLKYRNPETNKLRGVRVSGEVLIPPTEQGWGPYTYLCVRPTTASSPKKDESGLKRKTDNDGEMYSKNIRYDESDEDEQPSDLIILGLPYKTTTDTVREFFSQFGETDMVMVKTNPAGESRGFGFVRFKDKAVERKVVMQKHKIDGRWCDIKVPESQEIKNNEDSRAACKIFVGNMTEELTAEDLKEHFEEFGNVKDVYIPTPFRHFAFVQFSDSKPAKCLRGKDHEIKGVKVRIGAAVPKSNQSQDNYGNSGNNSGGYGSGNSGGYGNYGAYSKQQSGAGGYGASQSGFGAAFGNMSPAAGFGNFGGGGGAGAFGGGGAGAGGFGGFGGSSGYGGGAGYGAGAGPGNLDIADMARWALEMGYGRAQGNNPQGRGRRSNERRY